MQGSFLDLLIVFLIYSLHSSLAQDLYFTVQWLVFTAVFTTLSAQDYFLGPIDCYVCEGSAKNSTCADPFTHNDYLLEHFTKVECDRGACLKRLFKTEDGEELMMRTCTNELDFKLPLVNNVCQQESDGFGYLCMCGMPLCNTAESTFLVSPLTFGVVLLLTFHAILH